MDVQVQGFLQVTAPAATSQLFGCSLNPVRTAATLSSTQATMDDPDMAQYMRYPRVYYPPDRLTDNFRSSGHGSETFSLHMDELRIEGDTSEVAPGGMSGL
ncbi:hypothetical protein OPT61_g3875 [Boeremia exigua]|uniref:Uncharacterized protein n=1 Tax=Boeremia exigua TaxID=749465 RepID=A0ACC2IGA5_9PLEO|nr:hypothetical protein OPT61_g3875 [Boeremia exigua]